MPLQQLLHWICNVQRNIILHKNDPIQKTTLLKILNDEFATELASPTYVHMFITYAINRVIERSSQARFTEVLNRIDEYSLDIPLIWDCMGEILEPIVEDNEFSLRILKDVLHTLAYHPKQQEN
ncbi:UNVERIFIED_CONTAM: hypothetical protein NCL1_49602 [Trichonephila clavipes]